MERLGKPCGDVSVDTNSFQKRRLIGRDGRMEPALEELVASVGYEAKF